MTAANLNPDIQRSHNLRNAIHTWMLVLGSGALMAIIAYTVYGSSGLIWAAVFGAIGLWTMGRVSPQVVLKLYKAQPLSPDELPELHRIIRELARRADLPSVPQLYYVPSKMMNAFAVGTREDSAITVTDGLVRNMNLRQLAGIMAHEVSHIRNGDLKVMALADVLSRITSFMSTMGLIGVPLVLGTGMNLSFIGLALLIFAPTIGGLLQLGLSRAREYDADLDGATLTGDPEGLASALMTLERKQGRVLEGLLLPGSRLPDPSLLRTHPRTEDRVARLLALRQTDRTSALPQVAQAPETRVVPGPSIIPPIGNPRIRWSRMGVWY
jgi:heat shock protein HtpX